MLKFACTSGDSKLALKRVSFAVTKNSSMPALGCVSLCVTDAIAILSAFDMEVGIKAPIPGDALSPGVIALAPAIINDALKGAKKGERVHLTQTSATKLEIQVGARTLTIPLPVAPEDLPPFPAIAAGAEFQTASGLVALFEHVAHAMSNDETRENLTGVYLENRDGGHVNSVATDGHRLARFESSDATFKVTGPPGSRRGAIIPKIAAHAIEKTFAPDADYSVAFTDTSFIARRDGHEIVAKMIDGMFPDYVQVIPRRPEDEVVRQIVVDKAQLLSALTSAAAISSDKASAVVHLEMNGTTIVESKDPDRGEVRIELPFPLSDGSTLGFGINARYLSDALKSQDEATLAISFQKGPDPVEATRLAAEGRDAPKDDGPLSPCVIRGPESKLTNVVMPVRY